MPEAPILITGGAGFIGSHLVDALLSRGFAVRVLDNLSTGKPENLPKSPLLELIVGDIADAETVRRAVQGCQSVVHLAAVASVQASVVDPLGTHQSNLIGTLNLCEAMRVAGVRRVVFASSAAVYGNNGEGQALDEDTPKAPLTPYAVDKLASEYYLGFYQRQYGLEPAIFRLFNIYGPRQDPSSPYSGVISIFMERARRQQPISVFGDGEQTRDFFYVGDLISLLIQALLKPAVVPEAVNVGWGQATTLNQLLASIGTLLGGLPAIEYQPARPGDIRYSQAANHRLVAHYELPEATRMDQGLALCMAAL